MDLGDAAVLGVAEAADEGDAIQAEFMMREGEVRFGLGVIGPAVAATSPVVAAADVDGKAGDAIQGRNRSGVGVVSAEPVLADRTPGKDRGERLRAGGARH